MDSIEVCCIAQTPDNVDKVVKGLFDCFAEQLLPILFPPRTCEDCFRLVLNNTQLQALDAFLANFPSKNLTGYCDIIEQFQRTSELARELAMVLINGQRAISDVEIADIIECLQNIGVLPPATTVQSFDQTVQSSSIQQDNDKPTSISQDEMHQQQIEKLKTILDNLR